MTAYSILGAIFGAAKCHGTFQCDSTIDANGGILLWILLTLYMFKALGTVCDEYFVPSLEMISEKLELSNDVAGATFMAAGSSAPELFTSVVATFLIVNEAGVGAIIGSAIFNILVIVGATCACAGQVLTIWWYPLSRDCCFYLLAIFELAMFIGNDDQIMWYEALIMFLSYVAYCFFMKHNEKVANWARGETKVDVEDGQPEGVVPEAPPPEEDSNPPAPADNDGGTGGTSASGDPHHGAPHVLRSMKELRTQKTMELDRKGSQELSNQNNEGSHVLRSMKELRSQKTQELPADGANNGDGGNAEDHNEGEEEVTGWRRYVRDPLNVIWEFTMPTPERYWSLFMMSIFNIGFCTYVMVDAVDRCGIILQVSPLVMGLIFLAAGTSVPDALGSIAVAQQGEGDMAVANALGSNVFDILLGLGVPWLLKLAIGKEVLMPSNDLLVWIIILVVILGLFIAALVFNKWKLNKQMGALLMTLYFVHVAVALIRTFTNND
jgi:K+-dependent Na+/Ca+ exchanger-like protein